MIYMHTMEYYVVMIENEIFCCKLNETVKHDVMQSKSENDKYQMTALMCGIYKTTQNRMFQNGMP